nr:MAG TPA: hypothetical protein [Caudoviricetes sp.]
MDDNQHTKRTHKNTRNVLQRVNRVFCTRLEMGTK